MKVLKGQRILVTGGAGFIGSNLVEHFLNRDNHVICLDNLATGYRRNIEEFLDHSGFTFIDGDIRDLKTCQKATAGCDYVFHQAALGSVPRSINDPHTTNAANIDGTLNMLLAASNLSING